MNRVSVRGHTAWAVSGFLIVLLAFTSTSIRAVSPEPELADLEIPLPDVSPSLQSFMSGAPSGIAGRLASDTGVAWHGTWDLTAGRVDRIFPAPLQLVTPGATEIDVDAAARGFISDHPDLFGASIADLETVRLQLRGGVWWVTFQQMLAGLPVVGARLDLRIDEEGYLLFVQDRTLRGLETQPALLSGNEAEARASDDLLASGIVTSTIAPTIAGVTDYGPTAEVVIPMWDSEVGTFEARHAWRVRHDVPEPIARFRSYVDAETGEILARTNEIYYVTAEGTVEGDQQPLTPTDPYTRSPFRDLRIGVQGVGATYSDETGYWEIELPDANPATAIARLEGLYSNVNRADGMPDALMQGVADPNNPLDFIFDDGSSHPAERDVYFHANLVHDYMKNIDSDFADIDYQMPAAVNIGSTCNAFWNGVGINFFEAGGGCANTGQIADVIYHEYGHGCTQFAYAPSSPTGAMHEGFSDYIANTITDQPLVGLGFFGEGTWLRDSDNNRQWPAPECGGEPHCVGEVIAGCLWHTRENLINELGDHDAAVALSDQLFHFARYGGNTDFEGYFYDLLALDDDNGTLLDGTPHGISIYEAFGQHNVGPGLVLDIIHTPLKDTDQPNQPIDVIAVLFSPDQILGDSVAVYYSTEPIDGGLREGPTRLQMIPTGEVREYTAMIPGQSLGTRVNYYISGLTATLALGDTDPDGAPGNQHEYLVAEDLTAPVIAHDPKTERSIYVWPVPIEATVSDNQGVGQVALEFRINGIDQSPVILAGEGDGPYNGMFGGLVSIGDLVEYRIKAVDIAATPNTAYLPAAGYFALPIVRDIVSGFEDGFQDWSHAVNTDGYVDQWHLSTEKNHTLGGTTAWKFGDTGTGPYSDSADGILETLPVRIGLGGSLTFWHWMDAEQNSSTTAWDGGLVEVSTDDGAIWEPLIPIGGYTHTIVNNPASPFEPGYPVWSGLFDWSLAEFDLSAFDGQTIQLRWRFGTDGAATEEGWYVDDLVLVPTTDETVDVVDATDLLPSRTAILGGVPNPFNPRTMIRFAVATGAGPVKLTIHDASGRLVRTLVDAPILPGRHEVEWRGNDDQGRAVSTGIYFARIKAKDVDEAEKLVLMK